MSSSNIITTTEALEDLVQKALKTDAVALDTEFVWERTYYPLLGLIQLALSDEECYAIDPMAITDLSPLGKLLAAPGTIKILHDAPQDLVILSRATGSYPVNIFDTRLAAGFAGSSSTISLFNLIKEQLDTEIDKSETRTNWRQRPLTDKQLSYALNDVRYSRALRVLLLESIVGPRIKSWLQEELNLLNNPHLYEAMPDNDRYKRVRGINRLNKQHLVTAQALACWREEKARQNDKPRNHIIKDEIIVEIAIDKPCDKESLQKTSISPKAFNRYGEEICQIVRNAASGQNAHPPQLQKRILLNTQEKESLTKLQELISLKCDILGLDPSLIGNSHELKQLIKSLHSGATGQLRQTLGWRKEFLKDFLIHHKKN